MREIILTRGYVALVDDEDYEWLSRFHWYAERPNKSSGWYAQKTVLKKHVRMHCLIMGEPNSRIDHIDGNGLNNQRSNLRLATQRNNSVNNKRKAGVSGYRGVWPHHKKWSAMITVNYKRIFLGSFETKEEAAVAFNLAALRFNGAFAKINSV